MVRHLTPRLTPTHSHHRPHAKRQAAPDRPKAPNLQRKLGHARAPTRLGHALGPRLGLGRQQRTLEPGQPDKPASQPARGARRPGLDAHRRRVRTHARDPPRSDETACARGCSIGWPLPAAIRLGSRVGSRGVANSHARAFLGRWYSASGTATPRADPSVGFARCSVLGARCSVLGACSSHRLGRVRMGVASVATLGPRIDPHRRGARDPTRLAATRQLGRAEGTSTHHQTSRKRRAIAAHLRRVAPPPCSAFCMRNPRRPARSAA